jgi:hypothetical protein
VKLQFLLSSVNIIDTKDSYVNISRNESNTREEVDYVKEKIIYDDEKNEEEADEIPKTDESDKEDKENNT